MYYSKIVNDLAREPLKSQQKRLAQLYLIQGCKLANKKLIDIALSFGANLLLIDNTGKSPIEYLKEKELKNSKGKKGS